MLSTIIVVHFQLLMRILKFCQNLRYKNLRTEHRSVTVNLYNKQDLILQAKQDISTDIRITLTSTKYPKSRFTISSY